MQTWTRCAWCAWALSLLLTAGCCELLRAEARALIAEYSRCTSNEQCVRYTYFDDGYSADEQPGIGNSCVPEFHCHEALNGELDLDEFTRRGRDISARFDASCSVCVSGTCGPGGGAYCDEASGRCAFGPTQVDAGLSVDPQELAFGAVAVGTALVREVTIESVGSDTLYLEDLFVDGDGAFALDGSHVERILAPGAMTALPVRCAPEAPGWAQAVLHLHTNAATGRDSTIPLYCAAVAIP